MRHRALLLAVIAPRVEHCSRLSGRAGRRAAAQAARSRAGLAAGIALVRDGDFEGAMLQARHGRPPAAGRRTRQKDAAQAYVYLGVAFLELDQELVARGKFAGRAGARPAAPARPA